MASRRLKVPAVWERSAPSVRLVVGPILVLCIVAAGVGFVAKVFDLEWISAMVFGLWGVICAAFLSTIFREMVLSRRTGPQRAPVDNVGIITTPIDRFSFRAWATVYLTAISACFIAAVGAWFRVLDLPITEGQRIVISPLLILAGTAGIVDGRKFRRNVGSWSMLIDGDGFTICSFRDGPLRFAWTNVLTLDPIRPESKGSARAALLVRGVDGSQVEVLVDEIPVGAPVAYDLLRRYRADPELRASLAFPT